MPALGRLRLEDYYDFEFILEYIVGSRLVWLTEYEPVSRKVK